MKECLSRLIECRIDSIVCDATVEGYVGAKIGEGLHNSNVGSSYLRDLLLRNGNNEIRVSQVIRILVQCNKHNTYDGSSVRLQCRCQCFTKSHHTYNRHLTKWRCRKCTTLSRLTNSIDCKNFKLIGVSIHQSNSVIAEGRCRHCGQQSTILVYFLLRDISLTTEAWCSPCEAETKVGASGTRVGSTADVRPAEGPSPNRGLVVLCGRQAIECILSNVLTIDYVCYGITHSRHQ